MFKHSKKKKKNFKTQFQSFPWKNILSCAVMFHWPHCREDCGRLRQLLEGEWSVKGWLYLSENFFIAEKYTILKADLAVKCKAHLWGLNPHPWKNHLQLYMKKLSYTLSLFSPAVPRRGRHYTPTGKIGWPHFQTFIQGHPLPKNQLVM